MTAILAAVISCGVTVSAVFNSTLVGLAALWVALYGTGFLLSLLPSGFPTPVQALERLPNVLRGLYDLEQLTQLMSWSGGVAVAAALVGLLYFARRDV
jgi:hypothetical protein